MVIILFSPQPAIKVTTFSSVEKIYKIKNIIPIKTAAGEGNT
jgi:hypothetical protein